MQNEQDLRTLLAEVLTAKDEAELRLRTLHLGDFTDDKGVTWGPATGWAYHQLNQLCDQERQRANEAEESRQLALKRIDFENKAAFRYREERDALRAENERLSKAFEMQHKIHREEMDEAYASESRLREALTAVTPSHRRSGECWCGYGYIEHSEGCKLARAALAAPDEKGGK